MRLALAILAALALTAPGSAGAAPAPDRLLEPSAPSRTVPAARSRAAAALAGELGRFGVVDIDPRTARPRVVARLDGTLTGPRDAPPERIVLDYLREHADLFGDGGGLELARSYTTRGRVTRLVFEQRVDGAVVLDGGLVANVTTDGRLVNLLGAPRPDAAVAARAIDAAQARRRAGEVSGGRAVRRALGQETERVVLAGRPAWRTFVSAPGGGADEVVVDAVTGAALRVRSLTRDGKALVFDNSPGASVGGTQRQVELGAYVTAPGGPELYGPFAYVTADEDDDDVVDPGEDIPASAGTDYLYPYTPFQNVAGVTCAAPAFCSWNRNQPFSWRTNRNQAAVNAFYLASLFHDHLRASPIEFTPAKGAFEGNNRVWIDVADGAALAGGLPDAVHRNNAFNYTPPTGPAFMTFLLYTETSRDSADEAATIFHEYTHGMSARLMAGPGGVNTLVGHQSESINEATSDWHAADFLTVGGQRTDTAAPGEIHVGLGRSQGLDCPVGAVSPACPGSPDAGPGGYTYGDLGHVDDQPEDHADGEIWGETLWDLRRRLIALHGTALGVEWAELLVTAGMELSPGEPSFLDMRNAILEADAVYQGGHYNLLWSVFAARGMGYFAADLGSRDTRPAEDFSLVPPAGPLGTIAGTVRTDAGVPVPGARVTVGGLRGYAGTTTSAEGRFSLPSMDVGTYPRVYATAGGGLDLGVTTDVQVTAGATTTREIVLRRDWASSAGGGRVVSATGNDDPRPGWCGPGAAIDQDSATIWRTDSPALVPGPKLLTLELPEPIDVTSVEIDPSPGCDAGSSAMLGGWRLELSRDGQAFVPAASGTFGIANGFRRNPVTPAAGTGFGVRYVRLVALSSRDSSNPEFTGARYLTVTDLGVYGGRADLSAPDTSISGGPPEGGLVASRAAQFSFGASEAGASFECRLDGSAWTACDGGQAAYSGLADGVHAFEARARDARGNVDTTPATRGWSIDATPPETEITQGPAEGSTGDASDVTFGFGSEAGAAFHCRLDGEAWAPCASPRRWTDLAGGEHVVEVRAQDRAGNVDATPARRGWRVVTRPLASRTATYTIAAQRIAAVRSRGLRVAYSCLASCTLRWELRLDAAQVRRLKLGRRAIMVGKATSRRTSAGQGTASIKLSARAGRAVRRASRVTFTLRVSGAASAREERRVVVRR